MDFLGTPGMLYEAGGRKFTADPNGIVYTVPVGNHTAMLNMGAVPLTPVGWKDQRAVVTVSSDGKTVTVS